MNWARRFAGLTGLGATAIPLLAQPTITPDHPVMKLDDGTSRIRLGVLHLSEAGAALEFTPETNAPALDPTAWYGQHLNNSNRVVDFGCARSDGSAWLQPDGSLWRLKTWPRNRNFTLELSAQRLPPPAAVQCVGASESLVKPIAAGSHWRLPLNGAREYRWSISPPR